MASTNPKGAAESSAYLTDNGDFQLPIIDDHEPVDDILRKLYSYMMMAISDQPYSFEQMRSLAYEHPLKQLTMFLSENVHNPIIISALMILKWQFLNQETDNWGLNESRGSACEYVAWQFLTYLSPRDAIEYLLRELPGDSVPPGTETDAESTATTPLEHRKKQGALIDEQSPLLPRTSPSLSQFLNYSTSAAGSILTTTQNTYFRLAGSQASTTQGEHSPFCGLNALEIATIAQGKRFLSQKVVQRIVNDLWNGNIVLWNNLSVHASRRPQFFSKRTSDPYSRLRVPVYRKAFEAVFFLSFLALYYAVLVERDSLGISLLESLLFIWIAAFAYDGFSGIADAGMMFYGVSFWTIWDVGIIGTGLAFFIARIVGLYQNSAYTTDLSFDILSLEGLFLVPRICSLMSLNPYFGSLIPVLKEMTKAFLKFLPVIVILYIGFLTTFTMLARDRLTFGGMSWILIKVFFGSSTLGFDISEDGFFQKWLALALDGFRANTSCSGFANIWLSAYISPLYTPWLIFVCLTNILLISSVISLMSLSLTEIMSHARQEYLFQLSIYVLESSNSRRLTYFLPPLNLIPLLSLRPLRLFLSSESIRRVRIIMLKLTHFPFVAIIWLYESSRSYGVRETHSAPASSSKSRPLLAGQTVFPMQKPSLRPAFRRPVSSATGKERASTTPYFETGEAGSGPSTESIYLDNMTEAVDELRSRVEHLAAAVAYHRNR